MVETFKLDIGRFGIKEEYDGLEIIDKEYGNTYHIDGKMNQSIVQEIVDIMNELDAFRKIVKTTRMG